MEKNIDRFTLLPESLLLIIISFLPFKEAIRTSVLSKRWIHLWEKTTNIEFNELFFVKLNQPRREREIQRRDFLKFMTFWLDNCKEPVVEKFSLRLSKPENAHGIIERCFALATQHGLKELGLDFSDPNWEEEVFVNEHNASVELPKYVYEQKALEYLKLFSCGFLEADLLNLHALKEVSFGWVEVKLTLINSLLSNCKMIESLSLKRCWNSSEFKIEGDDLRLRRLVVDNCYFQNVLFKINAPNLIVFKYYGIMSLFEIKSPLVMEEVDLDFDLEFETVAWHVPYLCNLLKDVYPVRVLTVCSYILQVIHTGRALRTERDMNARHLILKTNLYNDELHGISFLLYSCPMLESLTFELGLGRDLDGDECQLDVDYQRIWMANVTVYECLISTLKVVEVKNFEGTVNGLLVLYYIIRCGRVLKKVNINVRKGEVERDDGRSVAFYRDIEEFVMTLPRASSDLEISVCY
ncbi:F-box protein At3g62230-like [Gastrolobium bilobum]|uniref:F-box protein At3g62230-like n=1 Tax=Gastrolobium bilobum TaxID=150636 RepID=UPI002AB23D38|nr:F-box protein At3g62230-like [Gastrolobium bilobum]